MSVFFNIGGERTTNFANSLFDADLESAKAARTYTSQRWLKRIDKEAIQAELRASIAGSQFFMGHSSLDYRIDNMVTWDLSYTKGEGGNVRAEPKIFIYIGNRRAGKTTLATMQALDHGVRNFHVPTMVIDASKVHEHWIKRYAFTAQDIPKPQGPLTPDVRARISAYFRQFNLQSRGYTNVVYKPYTGSRFQEEGIDKVFKLSFPDFKELAYFDPPEGQQSFVDLIDMGDSKPARGIVKQLFANPNITSFSDVVTAITIGSLNPTSFSVEGAKLDSASLLNYLNVAMSAGVVTDDPQPGIDFVGDMVTHDFVSLRHRLMSAASDTQMHVLSSMAPKIMLNKVINERNAFVSGTKEERERSRLTHKAGVQVVMEEADSIMPAKGDSYTLKLAENLGSKEGKTGFHVIAIVQDISRLSENFVGQADYVIMSQLDLPGNEAYFREQGVGERKIASLKLMPMQVMNNYGFKVSGFQVFDVAKKAFITPTTYPRPPLSCLKIV